MRVQVQTKHTKPNSRETFNCISIILVVQSNKQVAAAYEKMTRHYDSYNYDTATYLLIIATTMMLLLMTRIWSVYRSIHHQGSPSQSSTKVRRIDPMKTMVVLGSGGHTTEMLTLIKNLDQTRYAPLIYVVATTDTTSIRRLAAVDTSSNHRKADVILKIPRSREVGQSYISSIGTTLWSFLFAIRIVLGVRPNLLLCNGPGTCLPIAVVTLILRILGLCEGRIVFVESFCRVTR